MYPLFFQVSNYLMCSVSVHVTMAMTAGTTTSFPMSNHTRERVTVAKLTLENFYSNLITQHEERETRYQLCFLSPFSSLSWLALGSICSGGVSALCTEWVSAGFHYLIASSSSPKGAAAVCAGRPVNMPSCTKQSLSD